MNNKQLTRVIRFLDDAVEALVVHHTNVAIIPDSVFDNLTSVIAILENELGLAYDNHGREEGVEEGDGQEEAD